MTRTWAPPPVKIPDDEAQAARDKHVPQQPGELPAGVLNRHQATTTDIRRVGAAGLAAGLTMMIISRKRSRLRIVRLDNPGCHQASGTAGHRPRESSRSRPADILDDMDSRASDKIPGARVRVKRHRPAQPSSRARPREWLALADGTLQEARTEGPVLALVGEPLPYHPGRAERRSGVPAEVRGLGLVRWPVPVACPLIRWPLSSFRRHW
jgi:hypothetical protein